MHDFAARFTGRPLVCFGHRGAAGHAPENTLASFRCALELDADWVELDIHRCENELLVIHDDTLERTTNATGRILEHTLTHLRSLDAGCGEHIPLLQEVFDLVGNRAGINIELKGQGTAEPAVALAQRYIKSNGWSYDRILFSSFDHTQLQQVKSLDPAFLVGALFSVFDDETIRTGLGLLAVSVHVPFRRITKKLVDKAHDAGLHVLAYTVNEPNDLRDMISMGVDGVFTDYPDRVAMINT